MIKIEKVSVYGLEEAIRGMRNPMNSWDKSDSNFCAYSEHTPKCGECTYRNVCNADESDVCTRYIVGPNDNKLMINLASGGPVHAKYRRMITVYLDITAPLYWWKEFDTYKVGTVANSCSTMHKIQAKEFTLEDFSCEHLNSASIKVLKNIILELNVNRNGFNNHSINEVGLENHKAYWWQMIQLLPSSYNQKRTVMLNYEVLVGIYRWRKEHKLDEWREFCRWIEKLPYSEVIIGEKEEPNE